MDILSSREELDIVELEHFIIILLTVPEIKISYNLTEKKTVAINLSNSNSHLYKYVSLTEVHFILFPVSKYK